MNEYIIDDRMNAEKEADKILKNISADEWERILNLPCEEQMKAIDKYIKSEV